ncbi:MAG TPA: hypothetical protein DGG94_19625 [Micromonosporaceae bacterium]|nr:hypothetical protein [Micromonosporaceae bacterium]HCU51979.1 hypothetical protein [Micromonosporaceae bacterium]
MDSSSFAKEFKPRHAAIAVILFLVVNGFVTTPARFVPGVSSPTATVDPVPGRARPAPPIRVGSPVDGTWGNAGAPGSTPAGGHHLLAKASPINHWAVDLRSPAGTAVILYAASSDAPDDTAVTAAITQIVDNDACRLGGGGDFVTVGIYYDGILAGRVTYAHLNRNPTLQVGMVVARWGTNLGTVANLQGKAMGGSSCWTGPHVHLELRAETKQACWGRNQAPGRQVRRADSLGLVSGSLGASATTCP